VAGRAVVSWLLLSAAACVLLAGCIGPPSHSVPPEGSLDALVPEVIEAIDANDQAAFAALFAEQEPDDLQQAFDSCASISPDGRYRPELSAIVPYLFTIYLSGVSRDDATPQACMLHLVWDDAAWTIEGTEVAPSAVPTPEPGHGGPY
jgi:hypothetical protein